MMSKYICSVVCILFALAVYKCHAATPIRVQWIKSPEGAAASAAEAPRTSQLRDGWMAPHGAPQPAQQQIKQASAFSANPLLKWWTGTRHHASSECIWLDYPKHDALKAWEFQAQPRRHMVGQETHGGTLNLLWMVDLPSVSYS
jgi:hypothetical protein